MEFVHVIIWRMEFFLTIQHCIIGLARTRKYNALSKFMYIVCLQALMNVGYAHTI